MSKVTRGRALSREAKFRLSNIIHFIHDPPKHLSVLQGDNELIIFSIDFTSVDHAICFLSNHRLKFNSKEVTKKIWGKSVLFKQDKCFYEGARHVSCITFFTKLVKGIP